MESPCSPTFFDISFLYMKNTVWGRSRWSPSISNSQGILFSWSFLPVISFSGRTTNLSCSQELFYWLWISPNIRLGPLFLNSSEHDQHGAVVWGALVEGLGWQPRMTINHPHCMFNSLGWHRISHYPAPSLGLSSCHSASLPGLPLSPGCCPLLRPPPLIFSLSFLTHSQNKCLLGACPLQGLVPFAVLVSYCSREPTRGIQRSSGYIFKQQTKQNKTN